MIRDNGRRVYRSRPYRRRSQPLVSTIMFYHLRHNTSPWYATIILHRIRATSRI
nr:MAG TPA: hypothetical protein [Bacteriophage sp.]